MQCALHSSHYVSHTSTEVHLTEVRTHFKNTAKRTQGCVVRTRYRQKGDHSNISMNHIYTCVRCSVYVSLFKIVLQIFDQTSEQSHIDLEHYTEV